MDKDLMKRLFVEAKLPIVKQCDALRSRHQKTARGINCAHEAIIVSARDTMNDIVYGLDARRGTTTLTKPFALDVLLAKVRAAVRASAHAAPADAAVSGSDSAPASLELHSAVHGKQL